MANYKIGQYNGTSIEKIPTTLDKLDITQGYGITIHSYSQHFIPLSPYIVIYKKEDENGSQPFDSSIYQVVIEMPLGSRLEEWYEYGVFVPKSDIFNAVGYISLAEDEETKIIVELSSDNYVLHILPELLNNKIPLQRLIRMGFISVNPQDKYHLLINGCSITPELINRPYELEGLEIVSLMVYTGENTIDFTIDYQGLEGV